MKRLSLILLILVLLLTTGLFGCSQPEDSTSDPEPSEEGVDTPAEEPAEESSEPKVINFNLGSEPTSIDPARAVTTQEHVAAINLNEGLTRLDQSGMPTPGLAEEWEVSDDGLVYTFKLREGLTFSNGNPINAETFVYSWRRVVDPNLGSVYSMMAYPVKGAVAVAEVDAADADGIVAAQEAMGVEAVDETTLKVTLERPTDYFVSTTAFSTLFPVDPITVEANPEWADDAATYVSSGPFKLTEWTHGERLVFEKNENYWDAENVNIDKIDNVLVGDSSTEVMMFETGQLDTTYNQFTTAETTRLVSEGLVKWQDWVQTGWFTINHTVEPLNDVRVRQALNIGFDRDLLVDSVFGEGTVPAYHIIPEGLPDADGNDFRTNVGPLVETDIERAKELLAEAGYPNGEGLEFELMYTTNELNQANAEVVQEMWKQNLGITGVTLKNLESKVRMQNLNALTYDMCILGWVGDYLDPTTFLDLFLSSNPHNYGKFADPEFDAYMEAAATADTPEERYEALHAAEKIAMDQVAVIPYYSQKHAYLENDALTGVVRTALGPTDFRWADIDMSKK